MLIQQLRQMECDGVVRRFEAGERIHTENSYKYSIDEFAQLAGEAGFRAERCWVDRDSFFSVHYLVAQTKPVPGSR